MSFLNVTSNKINNWASFLHRSYQFVSVYGTYFFIFKNVSIQLFYFVKSTTQDHKKKNRIKRILSNRSMRKIHKSTHLYRSFLLPIDLFLSVVKMKEENVLYSTSHSKLKIEKQNFTYLISAYGQ